MKISGNAVRPGMVIEYQNKLWKVIKSQHVKPGKGPAYLQAELKDIIHGTKTNERFRSDEAIERAVLEQKECTFSYEDQGMYYFMDKTTYDLIPLSSTEIGEEQKPYMLEGIDVTIEFYEDKPLSLQLPLSIVLEVVETEPVVKGQTATSSFKPAILSNGIKVMVPQHIDSGEKIVVKPEDNSYIERARNAN